MNSGGGLTLTGNATTNSTQTIGILGIGTGNSTVTIGSQTGRVSTLAASSFSRSNNATALIRGSSLNQRYYQRQPTYAGGRRRFAAAGGHEHAQQRRDRRHDEGPQDRSFPLRRHYHRRQRQQLRHLRLTSACACSRLASRPRSSPYTTAANPDNAIAFNGTITASGPTLNSLLFNTATQTLNGAGALTINSGAVASTSTAEVIGSGFSSLALGNGEGVITVTSGNALTINTPISVTSGGGLTTAGAGTVTLGAANTYTGQTTVNQGTLAVTAGSNNVFNGATGMALQVNNGATVNIGATVQTITTLGRRITQRSADPAARSIWAAGSRTTLPTTRWSTPSISGSSLALNGTQPSPSEKPLPTRILWLFPGPYTRTSGN